MISNSQFKNLVKKYDTPLYVYDDAIIREKFEKLNKAVVYDKKRIYYAAKANSNISILKVMRRLGAYLDTSSPAEIFLGLRAGFKPAQILFTGNNLREDELMYALKKRVFINIDSLSQLERVGKLAPEEKIGIRINPAYGAGHHDYVITAGMKSRFGIYFKQVSEIKEIAKKYNLKIVGLHQHIGSGVLHANKFLKATIVLLNTAKNFENLEFIDFGGGLGVPYKPSDKALDVEVFGAKLSEQFEKFQKEYLSRQGNTNTRGKELILYLEPGRYLVAQAGTLLIEVTSINKNPVGDIIVGTNSGMTHLIRPALYSAYHEIVNITNPRGRAQKVDIVGNICESTDIFAKAREISKIREGDILAIKNTGAYGMAMASRFNGRGLPAEVLVSGKKDRLIRKRDVFSDLLPK